LHPTVKGNEKVVISIWELTSKAICDTEIVSLRLDKIIRANSPSKAKYEVSYDMCPVLEYSSSLYTSKNLRM
jgi:hypothetical protein